MVFDAILNPLLSLGPLPTITIVGLCITLLSNIAYKLLTDQDRMKHLKKKQKEHQAEMKKHKDNPDKMLKVQKKAMEANMEYMKSSFKPMFITMLPIIIVFGWMNAHLNFMPISPDTDFTTSMEFHEGVVGEASIEVTPEITVDSATQTIVDGKATWTLKGPPGEYIMEYKYENLKFSQQLLIDELLYNTNVEPIKNPSVMQLTINNERNYPIQIGGFRMTWIWSYILISLILNIVVRKIMKIH